MSNVLICRLEAQPKYVLGQEIEIGFALTNHADYSLWVLNWNTPLEGILSGYFIVSKDDTQIEYDGVLVTRGDPAEAQYVRLAPGESATGRVDISRTYPIAEKGRYRVGIDLRIHDLVKETDPGDVPIPTPINRLDPVKIPCEPVEFEVTGDGEGRPTLGQQQRAKEHPNLKKTGAFSSALGAASVPPPLFSGEGSTAQKNQVTSAHGGAYFKCLGAIKQMETYRGTGSDLFTTWFGPWETAWTYYDFVLKNFQKMADAMSFYEFTYDLSGGDDCKESVVAYTHHDSTHIHLCSLFWKQPPNSGDDSQLNTAVHEICHATTAAEDKVYGTQACKKLAKDDPQGAALNADNYAYFSNYVPVVIWGESSKYDVGSNLAVAMNNNQIIVEIHCGASHPNDHYYMIGLLDAGNRTILWDKSQKYDTGSSDLAVAIDDHGNIVEVHGGKNGDHYYRVGKLRTDRTIHWGASTKYDSGGQLAVAMDNNGNVVELHCGASHPEDHHYLVGTLDAKSKSISWGASSKYDKGSFVSVSMDDNGNIIEVHAGANYATDLYYIVGTLNAGAKTITWAPSVKYDTGTIPAVAVTKDGNIIEVHCGANNPEDHYYRVGGLTRAYGGSSVPTIEWGDALKYDTGGSLAVAVDDLGNVVEVHRGYNHPSDHNSIVGSMRV